MIAWRREEPFDDRPVGGHGYSPRVVDLFLKLVLVAGVSLRGAARVMEVVSASLGLGLTIPCWTTGRLWLLRLGLSVRRTLLQRGADWAWLIDHSVQIGKSKCLVIVGIRLIHLPERGQSLRHEDLHLVELRPGESWTCAEVDEALERASIETGVVPRVIVDDHGGDLRGGVKRFQERHEQTIEIYDAKHKAACLLKRRLEQDPRWTRFHAQVGQTRCSVQQTELAFLAPPAARLKSRYMNLGPQLNWAVKTLAVLRAPPKVVLESVTPERLKEKLGWVEGYAAEVEEWSQCQRVIDLVVTKVNEQGVDHGLPLSLFRELKRIDAQTPLCRGGRELAEELIQFVRSQAAGAKAGERWVGSTEVLESCFGKFKQLEKQQSRGGFTSLLLGFGSMLAKLTPESVREAMQASRTKDVKEWVAQTLGQTLFAKRKLAYASATETG